MPAVSQALIEFANHHRPRPAPGVEIIVTPRYQITLTLDFPIPGPNNVSWIRCRPDEADEVIREARATIAPRHVPVMWTLDPGTEPPDFEDHLVAHGGVRDRRLAPLLSRHHHRLEPNDSWYRGHLHAHDDYRR